MKEKCTNTEPNCLLHCSCRNRLVSSVSSRAKQPYSAAQCTAPHVQECGVGQRGKLKY